MATLLRKPRLLDLILSSVRLCGWDVLLSSATDDHPFHLSVFKGDSRQRLRIYIWNMTYGGYPRNPDEFRIQITGVKKLTLGGDMQTLLLGWSQDQQIFAGFDANKHEYPGSSPSIQIKRPALEKAQAEGFATQARANDEIAVAFRPDFLMSYVLSASQLHQTERAPEESKLLEKAIVRDLKEKDVKDLPAKERRKVLQLVTRNVRDARFRTNVLRAYDHRCCMCGLQLNLLDAAHIIPVDHQRGTDETKNGLSLCALHHRAFDHALVTVDPDYSVLCSEKSFGDLRSIGWDGGEKEFRSALRDQILLPPRRSLYPAREYLEFGQQLRRWAA
jgi:putative restriction endonuclease